jgi:site-specific recombinase XerD
MLASVFPRNHARFRALPLLGGVLDGLCEWLDSRGYPPSGIRRRVTVAPHLERILRDAGVQELTDLTAPELLAFAPRPTRWTPQIIASLVRSLTAFLTETEALALRPPTAACRLVDEYQRHLRDVRGLASSTVERQGQRIAEFLQFLDYDGHPSKLGDLQAGELQAFMVKLSGRMGRASMQKVAANLRGFVRFLCARGEAVPGLEEQIDTPRVFRDERLPRSLPCEVVRSLLSSIDQSTTKGLRDYAMLLMVATYGLRRGEIPTLTLDHVNWRGRTLRVDRPKLRSPLTLPLTDEVATALVKYLRCGRPPSSSRSLFLKVRAPAGPITHDVVGDAFDCWARRAGVRLPPGAGGLHSLRHSLAERLLREGAPLKAIGDVLGHRSPESTGVYLRLKVEDLRDAALPLPTPAKEERP